MNWRTMVKWSKRNNFTADPLLSLDLTDYGTAELGPDGLPITDDDTSPPEVGTAAA